jgi:hypothetical protein
MQLGSPPDQIMITSIKPSHETKKRVNNFLRTASSRIATTMPPTPLDFSGVQPFKAVRDNWTALKPYHDNYVTTISFATVTAAFLGTLSMIIKHGFKMPRLLPIMEVDELDPSHEHPNEYINVEDLAEAKLFEFEQDERAAISREHAEEMRKIWEQRKKESETAKESKNMEPEGENEAEGPATN